ncbi:hypothetical protein BHYA_0191g00190 [Botrytis hyacinthi]|uniref:Isopenicillin N synthase-like Fe(2+) 2OG dioxygenase domain-containing protein n=1 Tax=Botrytis hyacinthi TaxID=278943 RepID=A0A4Z1GL39_9HELO|nr:hypothetical protein BHYA_0191g00190 [Botrytis hyacinthi]
MPKDLNGHKPAGVLKTDDGKMDAMELYTLSRDEVLGTRSTRRDPEGFQRHREDCKRFFLRSHEVLSGVMNHLDKHLGLAPGALSALSPLEKPSVTPLRLLMARPQPLNDKIISLDGHTDIGKIAMLFHVVGGFQVLPAGSENISSNWRALSYLIRPDHNGSMLRLQSNVIPQLAENEEVETRSVDEWAAWRAQHVIEGMVRPQTRGGRFISMGNIMIAHQA